MSLFLLGYLMLYILLGHVYNTASFRRKYGFDPLAVKQPDPLMTLGETYRNAVVGVLLLMFSAGALHPELLAALGPLSALDHPVIRAAGVALLLASLALVRLSQIQLRASWRIAFDLAAPPAALITSGVYAWTRNPIYLGMVAIGFGFFLALPNAVTLTVSNLTLLLLQIRVRIEEQYLLGAHGEAYADYCRRTPRWLPSGRRA